MMGMHGEAWVNKAIQEADLLLALGMRFDDRVTGKLKEYAPHAKKIHIDIDASELGKNVPVDVAIAGDLRSTLRALLPGVPVADRSAWLGTIRELARGFRRPRHQEPAGRRPPLRRPCDARPVAAHRRPGRGGHGRGPAPDVGGPVLPSRCGAQPHHQRGRGHHGLRPACGHRREDRPARGRGLGGGRRRWLPDDLRRADDRACRRG